MTLEAQTTTRIRVERMDCASCATKIENALQQVEGVAEVNVSVAGGTVTVIHDGQDAELLRGRISGLGYKVKGTEEVGANPSPHDHNANKSDGHGHDLGLTDGYWWKMSKGILMIASGSALGAEFLISKLVPATEKMGLSCRHDGWDDPYREPRFLSRVCGDAVLDRDADDDRSRDR